MNALRIALCSMLLLIATTPLLAQGTYTQIDVPGSIETFPTGIDSAGDIVGAYVDSNFNEHGFLLNGGIYTTMDYPGGQNTELAGINNNGQIVGFTAYPGVGFLYNVTTQSFTTISVPGTSVYTYPLAINDSGIIAGCYNHYGECPLTGFELVGNKYTRIAAFPNRGSQVSGITSSGKLVGYIVGSGGLVVSNFIFDGVTYDLISIPTNAANTKINGVNPAGSALVGFYEPSSNLNSFGFVYQNKVLTTLQFPGASYSSANGINASGLVVGWFFDTNFFAHGFLWTPPAAAPKP